MKTVLVACRTMQRELEKVLKQNDVVLDEVIWIQSGLHNVSDTLRLTIQRELDGIRCADRVLLGFAACGNALVGVKTGNYQTVMLRTDDCISIMLGSYEKKKEIRAAQGETYFLTKGWVDGESNIYKEYLFCIEEYGREMTDTIYEEMLGAYKNLGVIDSKASDYGELLEETAVIAEALHLKKLEIQGTLAYLKRFILGPWEGKEFLVLPPYTTIDNEMLQMK